MKIGVGNVSSLWDFILMVTFISNGLKSVATLYAEPMAL